MRRESDKERKRVYVYVMLVGVCMRMCVRSVRQTGFVLCVVVSLCALGLPPCFVSL